MTDTEQPTLAHIAADGLTETEGLPEDALHLLRLLGTMDYGVVYESALVVQSFLERSRGWDGPIALGVRAELLRQLRNYEQAPR